MINNALEETTEIGAYYAESKMVVSEKGKEIERSLLKEWQSEDGKRRIEIKNKDGSDTNISVNDGKALIMYQVEQNKASIFEDPELFNSNLPSPKEQAHQLLEMVQDSHTISIEDEEEIAGRETYKLLAKANKDNTLFGDLELWIDKENWMILKTVMNSGDVQSEIIYTEIDFKAEFPADIFVLELPDNVEIEDFEDFSETTEITLDEAVEKIGKPLLYFPDSDSRQIVSIELDEIQGERVWKEVGIDYTKDDLPLFTLAVFVAPEEMDEEELKLELPGESPVTIRGKKD